ncbi:glycosyltransferase family 2 protein [Actinomadura violacea]|uniref:Glycosyltransferase family 2 protein n=1 Tax=Actinomadura violacea TaxID=2819934 RepID=A0ABS3RL57_9ACTN|nr:glycosyltransferase family 2 protein [Actinomadura violacea]MBO2457462.1 glycosyltransferase family 2 protein [Actinomadura violacea]
MRTDAEAQRTENVPIVYRALALGDYLLGRTDLRTASRAAGLPTDCITRMLHHRAGLATRGGPDDADGAALLLSVVVPVFNNATTLRELHSRLRRVLAPIGAAEILFVDDGSADESVEVIRELCELDPGVRLIRLSRNFGQQAALSAGLDEAGGSGVVMLDADLQDPPELIPELVERWRAGHDVVYMVRRNRKEGLHKRFAYSLFYRVFRYLADVEVPLASGDFSLVDRRVVAVLREMPERGRFLRGLRSWSGFRQTSIEYDRAARPSGESQYTLHRLLKLATDGLLGFSSVPLRLVSSLGIITALAGTLMLGGVLIARLSIPATPVGWASTISVLLLASGAQLTTVGMVGAYIARIYNEVKQRPLYIVMERIG